MFLVQPGNLILRRLLALGTQLQWYLKWDAQLKQKQHAYCASGKGDSAAHKRLRWWRKQGSGAGNCNGDALHYLLSHSDVFHVLCLLLQRGKQALGL